MKIGLDRDERWPDYGLCALEDGPMRTAVVDDPCTPSLRWSFPPPPWWFYGAPWPGGACVPFDPGYRPGGTSNWLGSACNVTPHDTPCDAAWYARRGKCSRVADLAADRVAVGLARCVH